MPDTNLNILVRVEGARQASAEITSVSHATAQVGKQTEETTKRTSALRKTLTTVGTGFLAYKAASWIKGAVTHTTELARSTNSLQKITGMDAKTAAGWLVLAKERGLQARQVNMGFITLARNTEKLNEHSKTTVKAFHDMGISAKQWQGLNSEQRMTRLADAFQHMKDPAQRAAVAQQLFGRSAQAMIPLLSKGGAALNDQVNTMGKASGMTNKSVKEQMKFVVAQREMHASMIALQGAVAVGLAPVFVQLAKVISPIMTAFASMMQKSGAFRVIVLALTIALTALIVKVKLAGVWTEFLAVKTKLVTVAQWLWNAALAANPIGIIIMAIVALVAGFVVLYMKVKWFREGVQAVWGWIKAHWPLLVSILVGPIGAAVIQIIKHWSAIKGAAVSAFNAIKGVVEGVAGTITSVFKGAINGIIDAINVLISALNSIHVSIPGWVPGLGGKGFGIHIATVGHVAQTGTFMGHAGTALVGENGPEMVHLPQGARVSPFVQSYGAARETVVQVPVYLDSRQIALALGTFTADAKAAR